MATGTMKTVKTWQPGIVKKVCFLFMRMLTLSFCFCVTLEQSINRRFNKQNDGDFTVNGRAVSAALLSPLYLGAIYFSGREITQMISVRHSTTFFAYALDSENFINLTFIIMTIVCTALMQTGKGDDNMFANVAAITTGFQGMQVLAYLKSILIEFAVFVSSVTFVSE